MSNDVRDIYKISRNACNKRKLSFLNFFAIRIYKDDSYIG